MIYHRHSIHGKFSRAAARSFTYSSLCNSLANDSSDLFCTCLVCYLTGPQIGLIPVSRSSPFTSGGCVSVWRARGWWWCMLANLFAALFAMRCGWRFPFPLCRVPCVCVFHESVRRKMSLWISKLIRIRNWFVSEQTNQINCKSSFSFADHRLPFRYGIPYLLFGKCNGISRIRQMISVNLIV